MPKLIPEDLKQEAIRLRVQERLGLHDIQRLTGLSTGTLSTLLRDFPLDDDEVRAKMSESALRSNSQRKYVPELSKFALMVQGRELSTDQKGRIAEAAILFRLEYLGYEIYKPVEGSRIDCIVYRPGPDRYLRLQVKWAHREAWGRPLIVTRNGESGKFRYISREHCDFVIGYDFETDTAFVFPVAVCEGHSAKACDEQYAEAWHLLDGMQSISQENNSHSKPNVKHKRAN